MTTKNMPAATLQSLASVDMACPMCGSTSNLGLQSRGTSPVTCDECGGEFDVILQPTLVEM